MSVSLVKVDPGATGWDKSIEANFDALNQDTGEVPLTMMGAVKSLYSNSVPAARRINGQVHLSSGIKSTDVLPSKTQILALPDQFMGQENLIFLFCRNDSTQEPFPLYVSDGGLFIAKELPSGWNLDFSNLYYPGK